MSADPPASRQPAPRPDRRATAVAVKHDTATEAPPRIVAKGHGSVAEQILALAFANGVKVREDADLVAILDAVEVDSEIPLHALAAVAEILTYLYRANNLAAPPAVADWQRGPAGETTERTR